MGKIFLGKEDMQVKSQIMNLETMLRTILRISHEIVERNEGAEDIVLFGIKSNGVPLAKQIKDNIASFENINVPLGELDITLQRDDYSPEKKLEKATESIVPCDINNKTVIIVDDVIFTGRTAKAAIETIFKYGRPKSLQLVSLIDRGHRELPIRADYIGKNVPTSRLEMVCVNFLDKYGLDKGVYILG